MSNSPTKKLDPEKGTTIAALTTLILYVLFMLVLLIIRLSAKQQQTPATTGEPTPYRIVIIHERKLA